MERGLKRRRCDEPANVTSDPKTLFRLVFPYLMKILDKDLAKSLIQTGRELRNYPHLQREFARLTGKLFNNNYPLVGFTTAAEKKALTGDAHQLIAHLPRYKRYTRWCQNQGEPYIKWLGDIAYGPVIVQVFAHFEADLDRDTGVLRKRFYCFKAATFSEMCRWVYDTITRCECKYFDAFLVMPEWKAKGSRKGAPPHIVYDGENRFDYADQYMLARLEMIGRTAPSECGRSSFVVFMKHRKKKGHTALNRLKAFLEEWYYNWPWERPNNEMKMTFTV